MVTFSIVMPIYNVENEIEQCIKSIQNQTFSDFEVICVDDCSTDNSLKILGKLTGNDSRFKVILHEKNQGVSVARNTALNHVSGRYLVFVDSDDWLELNALEVIFNTFQKEKVEVVTFDNYDAINDTEKESFNKTKNIDRTYGCYKIDENSIINYVGVVWNKAFDITKIKNFDVRFPVGLIIEDSEYSFKLLSQLKRICEIPTPLYNYRKERQGSYTTEDQANERIVDEIKVVENSYDYAIKEGLFKKYRRYFLELIGVTTKKIVTSAPHRRRYILEQINNLLIKMDFPNAFKDLDSKFKFPFWN